MTGQKIVAQRIEHLRTEIFNKMSQPQFAQLLGLDMPKGRSTVNNWEQGAVEVKSDALTLISQKCGVSADWLLGIKPIEQYSDNPDIKQVSDYTGLSTEAVTALHEYQEHGIQSQAKALDLLLTSREGKAVLGQVFLYLTRNYDSFSLPAGVPLEGADTSETSKSVVLWEDGKPKEALTVENLSEMFMVNILHDLGKLRNKIQEGGADIG